MTYTNRRSFIVRNQLFFVLLFFLLIRMICAFLFGWKQVLPGSDAVSYNSYALAILNGLDWLIKPDFEGHYREVGYPLFLALIYTISGSENLFAVYCFHSLIGTISVYYIYRLSLSMINSKGSFLTLFWAGGYVFYIWYTGMMLRETLIIFLMIYSFYHLWLFLVEKEDEHFWKKKSFWKFVISYVILFHTDARYLLYVPFFLIIFVWYKGALSGIKLYLAAVSLMILLIIPWSIRNYMAYDGLVLINARTLNLSKEKFVYHSHHLKYKMNRGSTESYPSEIERDMIKQGKNPNNRPIEEVRLIMGDVYPASSFVGRKLYYLKQMWAPYRFSYSYEPFPWAKFVRPPSLRHNLLSILCYGILIPFGIVALFSLIRAKNKAVWFLVFPIVMQALVHFLMWGRERYRLPIDAFIIIVGCYGISVVYALMKNRKNKPWSSYIVRIA